MDSLGSARVLADAEGCLYVKSLAKTDMHTCFFGEDCVGQAGESATMWLLSTELPLPSFFGEVVADPVALLGLEAELPCTIRLLCSCSAVKFSAELPVESQTDLQEGCIVNWPQKIFQQWCRRDLDAQG